MLIVPDGNMALGTWSGFGPMTRTARFCVGLRDAGNRYTVTATGSGPGGSFTVSRQGSGNIRFDIVYADREGRTISLSPNGPANGFSATSISRCRSGAPATDLAEIKITVSQASLAAAVAGDYSGTVTFLFEAE